MMETPIAILADIVALAAECRERVVELAEDVARLAHRDSQFGEPIVAEDEAA
jgi:hypothetical protein